MMNGIKRFLAMFLVIVLAMSVMPSVAFAAEGDNDAVIVKDTEEERIAEVTDEDVVYRSVYDKIANTITVYTIQQNEVVESKVIDLSDYPTNSWAMPRTGEIILAQTGFGYSLGTQVNIYGGPYSIKERYGFDYGQVSIHRTLESTLQQELRQAIERMIVLEGNLSIYLEASDFLEIISIVQAMCFDVSGAFSSAISAYTMEVEARVAAQEIHTQARFAAPKFAILYVTVYPGERDKLEGN